ncbi:MAG TPA: AraC family transcriptional regulator [Bryobacteraceae bacterium]|nr:AraC family transcriptional regulator [Bryobacteraceae bacterium]
MPQYREIPAPPRVADAIECLWHSLQTSASVVTHRVVPDGCADVLFVRGAGRPILQVVGPMTLFQDVELEPGAEFLGVRFRAVIGPALLGVPAAEIVDETVDLECLWGARARRLCERLADAKTFAGRTTLLCDRFAVHAARSSIQQAIGALERRRGRIALDALACQSGLSVRQFRRRCIEESGLSPKLLARILRFRQAWQQAQAEAGEQAGLAAECGYADQSHMIAEFRRFSGLTPGRGSIQRTN